LASLLSADEVFGTYKGRWAVQLLASSSPCGRAANRPLDRVIHPRDDPSATERTTAAFNIPPIGGVIG
jgi:hypothetical protein